MSQTHGGGKQLKGIVKAADIAEDLQTLAFEKAHEALAQFETERDVARHIKQAFDAAHGVAWHCVVGKSFGSFVTHDRCVCVCVCVCV